MRSHAELIQAIIAGDNEALLELVVDRCGAQLEYLAKQFQYDGDLTQDLCVHLFGADGTWSRLRQIQDSENLLGWVYRIAQRLCVDQTRARKRRDGRFKQLTIDSDMGQTGTTTATEEPTDPALIVSMMVAIEKLEADDRAVIYQVVLGGKTAEEFATENNQLPATVRKRKQRALERLRAATSHLSQGQLL